MSTSTQVIQVGHVLRVGRGWADVEIDNRVRRVSVRPDLLVRAGSTLKIINEQGVALIPTYKQHMPNRVQ